MVQSGGDHAFLSGGGDPRVMAVFSGLVAFGSCLVAGFDNRRLVQGVNALLSSHCDSGRATYDLRQLRRKGLIAKVPRKRQNH